MNLSRSLPHNTYRDPGVSESSITQFLTRYEIPEPPAWTMQEIVSIGILHNLIKYGEEFGKNYEVFKDHRYLFSMKGGLFNDIVHLTHDYVIATQDYSDKTPQTFDCPIKMTLEEFGEYLGVDLPDALSLKNALALGRLFFAMLDMDNLESLEEKEKEKLPERTEENGRYRPEIPFVTRIDGFYCGISRGLKAVHVKTEEELRTVQELIRDNMYLEPDLDLSSDSESD